MKAKFERVLGRMAGEFFAVINDEFELIPYWEFRIHNGFTLHTGWLWVRLYICVYRKVVFRQVKQG